MTAVVDNPPVTGWDAAVERAEAAATAFRAIQDQVAAQTRNAVIFRPSARATRAVEILQRAGEAGGLPPHALQVSPDATLEASQHLFHHDGVGLIWTTGDEVRRHLGPRFGVAHGMFLPHVLRYNAAFPAEFMPAAGYGR